VKTFERFEFRLSEEDRRRLRTLAEQTSRTESGVVRFLIRQADIPQRGDIPPLMVPFLTLAPDSKRATNVA